ACRKHASSKTCARAHLRLPVLFTDSFRAIQRRFQIGCSKRPARQKLRHFLRVHTPGHLQLDLEHQLESMRDKADLPKIRAVVGGDAIDALNLDQDAAVLNGLNYKPHPVFQNYSAYTPALQRLNAEFFKSKPPQYLLWRTGSIDGRFPTLDDGEVLLTI